DMLLICDTPAQDICIRKMQKLYHKQISSKTIRSTSYLSFNHRSDPKKNYLVFGTRNSNIGGSPYIVAVDLDGELIWVTLLDKHHHAIITQSATILMVMEFAKLDLKTGSAPPIDLENNLVYIATGNNYGVPLDVIILIIILTQFLHQHEYGRDKMVKKNGRNRCLDSFLS
ncbi:12331_t:CDS:2, partial [Funneliformis mosseae]